MNDEQRTTTQPLGKCPACGGNIIEGKKGFGCSNWRQRDGECRFVIWKEIAGQKITPQLCKALLSGETTSPMNFLSKEGKEFTTCLRLEKNDNEGRWAVRFVRVELTTVPTEQIPSDEADAQQLLGRCPRCGGEVIEGSKGFGCKNWRQQDGGCRFVIWKEIAGKKLNETDVRALLEHGETGIINNFISKKGKSFSARLKLDKDYKTIFEF